MGSQLELLKNRLFDKDGQNATNFKFFPGTVAEASPEDVAQAINESLSQIESGEATEHTDF